MIQISDDVEAILSTYYKVYFLPLYKYMAFRSENSDYKLMKLELFDTLEQKKCSIIIDLILILSSL